MSKGKTFQNKRIVDAKHPLVLHVKPDDIRSAKRKDPASCAIARSAIRGRHVLSARIGQKFALIEYSSHFERYCVNKVASEAVREFDKDGTFIEGDYALLPIAPCNQLTGKAHSGPSGKSGKHLTRRVPTRNIFKSKECLD